MVFIGNPPGVYDEWLRDNIANEFINTSIEAGTDLGEVFEELTSEIC